MGDMGDVFKALKAHGKALRAKYGVECPVCTKERPRANASILLPQARCRVCKYIDPRPYLTKEQLENANST